MESKFKNCWILESGRVVPVKFGEHDAGYTQKEIEYNEKHWLKISNGNPINFEYFYGEVTSINRVTSKQKNKAVLILETL